MWDNHREKTLSASESETLQVVCFCVGGQEYALDIMRIKEIINPLPLIQVPYAPGFIEGMIELRGSFLAVIDLRKRFGCEPSLLAREHKYIVAAVYGQNLGLIVDRVLEVRRIAGRDIGSAPEAIVGPRSQFVKGVARWDERIAIVVDLDAVLTADEHDEMNQLKSKPDS